jgi:rhodanese-related sulfurtransferase
MHSPEFIALCESARQNIEEISIEALKKDLDSRKQFHLIDVRETEEFVAGHIPSAQHLSRGVIEIYIHKAVPDKHSDIVLYCGGGNRSALSADNLKKMGYTHVKSMAGGFKAWVNAHFPVTQT